MDRCSFDQQNLEFWTVNGRVTVMIPDTIGRMTRWWPRPRRGPNREVPDLLPSTELLEQEGGDHAFLYVEKCNPVPVEMRIIVQRANPVAPVVT